MTDVLDKELAEAALAAVREQFRAYLPPGPADHADRQAAEASAVDGCELPALVENYDGEGNWAIEWEAGPDEWAYRAFGGGFSHELYHEAYPDAVAVARTQHGLTGADATRWGAARARRIATEPSHPRPDGVFTTPYFSFVLMLYPDRSTPTATSRDR